MTKKEFKYMEHICKELWKWLSKNLQEVKPDIFFKKFLHGCPACELSKRKDCGNYDCHDCTKCPIDVWRNKALEYSEKGKYHFGESICAGYITAYSIFMNNEGIRRKKAALSISRYKWTMLPVHKRKKFLEKYKSRNLFKEDQT